MAINKDFTLKEYHNIYLQSSEKPYHDDYDILCTIFNNDGTLGQHDFINREIVHHKNHYLRISEYTFDEVFILLGEWERNIHHYLTEYLSAIDVYFEMIKTKPWLMIIMKDFQRNRYISKALGIYERVIFMKNNCFSIKHAWTANAYNIFNIGITEKSIYHKISEYTLNNVNTENVNKMWISRRNLQSKKRFHNRRILNIEELVDIMNQYGYEEYFADDEKFEVSLCKIIKSKHIVTEIGAACDNVLFRKDGCFNILYPIEVKTWAMYFSNYGNQIKTNVNLVSCGTQEKDPAFIGVNERNHPWVINTDNIKPFLIK